MSSQCRKMWRLLIGGFLLLDTSLQQEIGKHLRGKAGAGQGLGNGEPEEMRDSGKGGRGEMQDQGNWWIWRKGGPGEMQGLGNGGTFDMEDLRKWRTREMEELLT
jgi:hypothetical protein